MQSGFDALPIHGPTHSHVRNHVRPCPGNRKPSRLNLPASLMTTSASCDSGTRKSLVLPSRLFIASAGMIHTSPSIWFSLMRREGKQTSSLAVAFELSLSAFEGIEGDVTKDVHVPPGVAVLIFTILDRVRSFTDLATPSFRRVAGLLQRHVGEPAKAHVAATPLFTAALAVFQRQAYYKSTARHHQNICREVWP